jgi:hypothetical protein
MKMKNDDKGLVIVFIAGAIALGTECIPMKEKFKYVLAVAVLALSITSIGLELKDIYDYHHEKDEDLAERLAL